LGGSQTGTAPDTNSNREGQAAETEAETEHLAVK